MCGYLWFLFNNREVSYRAALNLTVNRRQNKLYQARGFDIERWQALMDDAKSVRNEIRAVANEYNVEWDERADDRERKVTDVLHKEGVTDDEEEEDDKKRKKRRKESQKERKEKNGDDDD